MKADGKTFESMSDEYFDMDLGVLLNKWDKSKNEIEEFSEKDTEGWVIGPNFIAHPAKEAGEDSAKASKEVKQAKKSGK